MFEVKAKRRLNDSVTLLEVEAPLIAAKAKAGQFIVFRVDEFGERIPLTIADASPEKGTVTIIFQHIGASTKMLAKFEVGDFIHDFAGPLGVASHLEGVKRACVVGGGVGCAIAYPQAKALHAQGAKVDIIAGFRSKDIVILEDEMRAVCDRLYVTTDDGSHGEKGFVTDKLNSLIESGNDYDMVIAIGPVLMMKFVCKVTESRKIPTVVSLNPIMIDGTGMCGCCRVTVDGKTRFACVDGPDFDGHKVDFDELMVRNTFYKEQEQKADHECRLVKGVKANA
jgi:ferredoxin--NADP+ reductase